MSKRRLKITVISGLSLVVSCANESETNSSVATKNSTEDLELAGNKRPDLKTPPLTIEEFNKSKFKVNPFECFEINDVGGSKCTPRFKQNCGVFPAGIPAAASLNPRPARPNAGVPMAQNYCVPGNVVDSSKVAQVFGVDPKSPAWPTFQVRNRSFFISIHQPTFRISTDIVNDPDAQASRLLAARTVCKTIKNGTYRLPRPNEFPNQIFAEVKSTAMTELKSYLEKKRSEEPARFLSSFSGFTFKSPDTFNSAPDELKTRAITNEVLFAPGGLPDYPYMSMIVDDETTTYPQLQVYRSISGTDGRISYATEIVNLDKATDNYKEPMCIDRCGVKRPGCETGFSNGGGVSPIIKCLNRGQYMTAGFLCVKD